MELARKKGEEKVRVGDEKEKKKKKKKKKRSESIFISIFVQLAFFSFFLSVRSTSPFPILVQPDRFRSTDPSPRVHCRKMIY